ncbi:MAG: cytochrome c oxidase assembly protein [Alphaproteobacteria bacterium]
MRNLNAHNRSLLFLGFSVVVLMVGLSYASVPLYRLFCQVTGYGGTTQRAAAAPHESTSLRSFEIRFNADISPDLPWSFYPAQGPVTVKLGEETLIHYRARNNGNKPIVGTAVFNVTPDKVGRYFDKVQCFCFSEQRLEPGQEADLPVSFFIDPTLAKDASLNDIKTITLSYTFFPAKDSSSPSPTPFPPSLAPPSLAPPSLAPTN